MDPFTQRMLEKAEQRSRALGISNASKFPLTECSGVNVASAGSTGGGDAGFTSQKQQKKNEQQQQQLLPLRSSAQLSTSSTTTTTTNASTNTVATTTSMNKLQVVEKKSTMLDGTFTVSGSSGGVSPNKVLRQFSAVDKENMEMGIEINITTDKNIEVQVQVEEQELTDDDEGHPLLKKQNQRPQVEAINQPLARLRDTSRNRLQRLGALYSETADLSSPIHRTEGKFSAEDISPDDMDATAKKTIKQRYGKLATLASTINEWEDDTSHHTLHTHSHAGTTVGTNAPPPKPDLPSRRLGQKKQQAPSPPRAPTQTTITAFAAATKPKVDNAVRPISSDSSDSVSSGASNKVKQLKWDPKVINSLEAQGFQRRESNTAKLAYDYGQTGEGEECTSELKHTEKPTVNANKPSNTGRVGKLTHAEIFNVAQDETTSKSVVADKKLPNVKTGMVSGRAAVFEHKAAASQQSQQQRPQKDPTELTLKERMQLFERNKGEALVPKAAFGMAPSINKIRQEAAAAAATAKREGFKAPSPAVSTSSLASIKANADINVRDKVAALVANATTISENKIKADIYKQRQEDMQVLANRFNKQKEIFVKEQEEPSQKVQTSQPTSSHARPKAVHSAHSGNHVTPPPPPPPPPPAPLHVGQTKFNTLTTKRRSPGDVIDEDTKRPKKSNINRLYPALSEFDSNDEEDSYSENDNCCSTTATPPHSGRATADDEIRDQDENNCNESYEDSEEDSTVGLGTGSLGREVLQAVTRNDQQQQHKGGQPNKHNKEVHYAEKDYYYGDSSMNSSEEASMGVDDYLDEALDDEHIEDNEGDDDFTQESDDDAANVSKASRGSKGTTASNSFSFKKTPKRFSNCLPISEERDDYRTPQQHPTATASSISAYASTQPVKSELSVNQEDENMVTLVHTVSFYRRQQTANSNNNTPVRKICREQQVLRTTPLGANFQYDSHQDNNYTDEDEDSHSETDSVDDSRLVQEKIKKLIDEVCKQQQVIAQTSQALNLCAATIEFSGSTESVEGERHLLVATHRRQACLDEVQRLRVEKSLRPIGAPKEKGRLTVKEITVPLRQDYIRKLAADTISGHHLVCLLKYNEHVLATKTVPTLPGLLAVKFPDVLQLNNVYADFRITLEIYGMTAQREVLPHEVKYHINLNKKSGIKTPKKKGGSDNRLVMPPVQSPAGPNVVRTPALVQYGFAIFSLREIQRTTWTLTQVLGVSPLDGAVHMKVNCELSVSVEHKGFLTMFEDISGFGAWHRRWCHLNGTMLNYWKYPDDEKKKTPMGSIDLYTCCTQKVTTAPRDICARLNTMLLECQRPAKDSDQESLIVVPNGRATIVRHLLSADTKEEREEWCAYFNKALTLLRAWGPPQC